MNKMKRSIGMALGVMLLASGCITMIGCKTKSPERIAYNTLGSVAVTTDAAMKSWGSYVKKNNIPVTDITRTGIRDAYAKYQATMAIAQESVVSIKSAPPGSTAYDTLVDTVASAGDDLIKLIIQFIPEENVKKLKLNKKG